MLHFLSFLKEFNQYLTTKDYFEPYCYQLILLRIILIEFPLFDLAINNISPSWGGLYPSSSFSLLDTHATFISCFPSGPYEVLIHQHHLCQEFYKFGQGPSFFVNNFSYLGNKPRILKWYSFKSNCW